MKQAPVYVVGVGEAAVVRGTTRNAVSYAAEASLAALSDAGLSPEDVDGLLTTHPMSSHHHMIAPLICEYLGIEARCANATSMGGISPFINVRLAASLVASGACSVVLVTDGDVRAQKYRQNRAHAIASELAGQVLGEYEEPYGPTTPSYFAMGATRYMAEHGARPEDLARIAVIFREHARLTPMAEKREPITVDDVLASPVIASPLHLLDCCLVSDWGGAFVVADEATAKRCGSRAVRYLGGAEAHRGFHVGQVPSLTDIPISESARSAYAQAGIGPEDVDFAMVYDSFTITALLSFEGLGFCAPGESARLCVPEEIGLGGRRPVNPHGGLLSYSGGHSHLIIEAVRQLRGETGARQVPSPQIGVCQGTAALLSSSVTLLFGR